MPAPVVLQRHRQWTDYDPTDIGASGYAKGRGKRGAYDKQMRGQSYLTGRQLPPEIMQRLADLDRRFGSQMPERGTQAYRQRIGQQKEIFRDALRQGYTLADLGREGVVAGGMAAFSELVPELQNMGWSLDPNLGTWRHSSWGDDTTMGGYVDQSYEDYYAGLQPWEEPEAGAVEGGEGYAGGPEGAGTVVAGPEAEAGGGVVAGPAGNAPPPVVGTGGQVDPQTGLDQTTSAPPIGQTFSAGSGGGNASAALTPPPDVWASTGAPGGGGGGNAAASPFGTQGGSGNRNTFSNPQFFGGGGRAGNSRKGWSGGGSWVTSDRRLKDLGLEPELEPKPLLFSNYRR